MKLPDKGVACYHLIDVSSFYWQMTKPTITASRPLIPLWVKVCYTLFVATLVPVYWWYYGPANFLWGSDIALLLGLLGFWLECSLLVSMMAVMVVIADSLWVLDFVARLLLGPELFGSTFGTDYMFNADTPLFVRLFSLFHAAMPPLLLWGIFRLAYHRRALMAQIIFSWFILPISYLVSDVERNINWVYGFGAEPQQWLPEQLYVVFLMVLFPIALFLPTHLLLRYIESKWKTDRSLQK